MRSSRRKKRFAEKAGNALNAIGLPADATGGLPLILMTGQRYAQIENHRGVLQLDSKCVRLLSPIGVIRLDGHDMLAASMDNERILLEGVIHSVTYE